MNTVDIGKKAEIEAYKILRELFDEITYIGNRRKTFDYECFKEKKKFNVEVKFSSGTGVIFYPKELEADILLLKLKNRWFIFDKLKHNSIIEVHNIKAKAGGK